MVFGNPETTPGGQALKFYASVRLDIRRIGHLKQGEEQVGTRVRVKVVKNKCAPPFRQAEFEVLFGQGVNRPGEVLDLGVGAGLIEKSGSHFVYGDERLGNGRERACASLQERPELMESLRAQIMARSAQGALAVVAPEEEAANAA